MSKHTPGDYPYIRRWGELMGSNSYYIEEEIKRARADGAPQTAIYKLPDNKMARELPEGGLIRWARIENVSNIHTRHYFTSRGWMKPDWTVPDA